MNYGVPRLAFGRNVSRATCQHAVSLARRSRLRPDAEARALPGRHGETEASEAESSARYARLCLKSGVALNLRERRCRHTSPHVFALGGRFFISALHSVQYFHFMVSVPFR